MELTAEQKQSIIERLEYLCKSYENDIEKHKQNSVYLTDPDYTRQYISYQEKQLKQAKSCIEYLKNGTPIESEYIDCDTWVYMLSFISLYGKQDN